MIFLLSWIFFVTPLLFSLSTQYKSCHLERKRLPPHLGSVIRENGAHDERLWRITEQTTEKCLLLIVAPRSWEAHTSHRCGPFLHALAEKALVELITLTKAEFISRKPAGSLDPGEADWNTALSNSFIHAKQLVVTFF